MDNEKYEYETEMSADIDALAVARKALADNDEWLAANDLDDDRSGGGAIEAMAAVLVAYLGFGLFVAAVFLMAGCGSAQAAEDMWTVDFNVASVHSQENYYIDGAATPFNEDNQGLGIRYGLTDHVDVMAGFYDNSFHKTSVYAGVEWHTSREYLVSVGVAVAAVTGYSGTPTETPLIFLPVVQLGQPEIGMRFGHMPVGEVKFTTFQLYLGF
jgi:hypothetical protein